MSCNQGKRIVMRGDEDDEVSVCTENNVFNVKEAETSNSLLLVDSFGIPPDGLVVSEGRSTTDAMVLQTCHRYLELTKTRPNWQKLLLLLEEKTLKSSIQMQDDISTYSVAKEVLLDRIRASESQLKQGLEEVGAIEVEPGHWCVLDGEFRMRVVSAICNFVSENSWQWDNVPKEDVTQGAASVEPEVIVRKVLNQYFSSKAEDEMFIACDFNKVTRFFGEFLLQSCSAFNLDEFMTIWQNSLPIEDGVEKSRFEASLDCLQGLAVVHDKTIKYLPASRLSLDVQERLAKLFDIKQKWTIQEITPFIAPLTTPKLNEKALLTKYARAVMDKGVQHFVSKHRN